MTELEAMTARHSVRSYYETPIEEEKVEVLRALINEINENTGLHFQIQTEEPGGFSGMMAKYGHFDGVRNYLVLVGPKDRDREVGYYGEKVVLAAQMLGLNTCWVALTFNSRKAIVYRNKGERLYVVISLGYGKTQGVPHKQKDISACTAADELPPGWFVKGAEAAMLAPTAINQQKFRFSLIGNKVYADAGTGPYTELDLGIAEYHFDVASGDRHFGLGY